MAKKVKKSKKSVKNIVLNGCILSVLGLALFGMAFLPAYSSILGNVAETRVNHSLYSVLSNIFENGFGEQGVLVFQILTLVYFVVAFASVVVGCLMLLGVVKCPKLDLAIYLVNFIIILGLLITFFATYKNGVVTTYSTWLYLPLGVSLVPVVYKVVKMVK